MPFAPTIAPDASLAEVRGHILDAGRHILEQRARPEAERNTDDFRDEVRSATEFINSFDHIERALAAGERAALAEAEAETRARLEQAGLNGPRAAFLTANPDARTAGEQVTTDELYAEFRNRPRNSPGIEVRNLLNSVFPADGGAFAPVGQPTLYPGAVQRRRAFVRDLIGVQQTGLNSIPYIREVGAVANEGGASAVAEASAKPEVTIGVTPADAPVRKIAGWIPVTEEIVSDAPTLRGYIDQRLGYMVMIREEFEVLNGSGSAPHLEGINTISGTQTQTAPTGDYPAIVGRAIGKIENVDGEADGLVTNALDYWLAITTRNDEGFDGSGSGRAPSIVEAITWGLTPVRTRAMTAGSALVGAFRIGCTLFERSGVTIRTTDSHEDYFIKNQLVILAEERVAFAIHRANLFCKLTVPAGS